MGYPERGFRDERSGRSCTVPLVRSLHSEAYEVIARALANVRNEKGLTQAALATRLNRPQSFVSKFEQQERRLDLVELLSVLDALEIDRVAFMTELARQIDYPMRL